MKCVHATLGACVEECRPDRTTEQSSRELASDVVSEHVLATESLEKLGYNGNQVFGPG